MAAPIEVESDGSVRDLFKDPPFDLEKVRFDVSGPVAKGDLDDETLETLFEQLLRTIYDKIGVTDSYPSGQLPNCHKPTLALLTKHHRQIWADSFTKFTGYRTCDRLAKDIAGKGKNLPEDIKNLILCPSAPVLLSYVALVIFRKPPTGSPGKNIISMFCTKKVLKWLPLAIRIYERNQSHRMYISVNDKYDLDDGRQSKFIRRGGKKYLRVKSHPVDDSVFQPEIDQYFNCGESLESDNSDSSWGGISDHDNHLDNEMDIDSQPITSDKSVQPLDSGHQMDIDSQPVTSDKSVQPLDSGSQSAQPMNSGPQSVIRATTNDSDDKLEKLYTMLHRHEPVFLKVSREFPEILNSSRSTAKDLMQSTILFNETRKSMATLASEQSQQNEIVARALGQIDVGFRHLQNLIRTSQEHPNAIAATESNAIAATESNATVATESTATVVTELNAIEKRLNAIVAAGLNSIEEGLKETVAEKIATIEQRLNKTDKIAAAMEEAVAKLQPRQAERLNETVTDKIAAAIEEAVAKLQPRQAERLNETVTDKIAAAIEEAVTKLQPRQAAMDAREIIGALDEAGMFETIIERVTRELEPHVQTQAVAVGNAVVNALNESEGFQTVLEKVGEMQPCIDKESVIQAFIESDIVMGTIKDAVIWYLRAVPSLKWSIEYEHSPSGGDDSDTDEDKATDENNAMDEDTVSQLR